MQLPASQPALFRRQPSAAHSFHLFLRAARRSPALTCRPPPACLSVPVCRLPAFLPLQLCLDIIQEHWSPCHNICSILTSIQSLLTDPNCASPANPEAAQVRA